MNVSPSTPPAAVAACAIVSRMSSSDSVRGSSAVRIVKSASRAATSAIIRRFSRSRKPALPKTAISRPPSREHLAAGFEHVFERVGRVREIDQRQKILPLVDALHPSGDRLYTRTTVPCNLPDS